MGKLDKNKESELVCSSPKKGQKRKKTALLIALWLWTSYLASFFLSLVYEHLLSLRNQYTLFSIHENSPLHSPGSKIGHRTRPGWSVYSIPFAPFIGSGMSM